MYRFPEGVDAARDAQGDPVAPSIAEIQLRQLSSGKDHPEAKTPSFTITLPSSHNDYNDPEVLISGDFVAFSIRPISRFQYFFRMVTD